MSKDLFRQPAGNDTIVGGNGKDIIISYGGDNNINAGGDNGKDVICTGNGNDTIEGGNGNDEVNSNGGRDTIDGGNGTDICLYGENVSNCEKILACGEEVPPGCDECKGKVSNLTLKYNGEETTNITVKQKNKVIVFNASVSPGENFSFQGTDNGTFGNEIKIYKNYDGGDDDDDDDDDDDNYVKIHTSCSKNIGPGLIAGDFEVVSGDSRDGGLLCDVNCEYISECNVEYYDEEGMAICHYSRENRYITRTIFADEQDVPMHLMHGDMLGICDKDIEVRTITVNAINLLAHFGHGDGIGACETICHWFPPQAEEEECNECDGKVIDLNLKFNGSATSTIKVKQKNNDIVFNADVGPGEIFSFSGTDNGTFGTEIKIYINDDGEGDDDDDDDDGGDYVKIHTSCSKNIGPGLISGDFEVITGNSKNGGLLCPMPECGECDGKITNFSLQFNGDVTSTIKVKQKNNDIVFNDIVGPGEVFSFNGTDNGTFGTEIKIYINGDEEGDDDDDGDDYIKIHTSCSQEINPGFVVGDFKVITGASKYGGALCELAIGEPEGCAECDGKVNYLTLKYNGSEGVNITIKQGNDVILDYFTIPGEELSFAGRDGGDMGSEIKIYKNYTDGGDGDDDDDDGGSDDYVKIHTSCSQDIGIGFIVDDFEIIAGTSKNGGPLCLFQGIQDGQDGQNSICGENKVNVCHYPPGNPENFHDICISYNGVQAHIKHGDVLGKCIIHNEEEGRFITLKVNKENLEAHLAHGDSHAECPLSCGNGLVLFPEECDDNNIENGDGCSLFCLIEPGYECTGEPSVCALQECGDCDGKVTNLTLQYNGSTTAVIRVVQKKNDEIIFNESVNAGEQFSFVGTYNGTLGTEIKIYENYDDDGDDDDDDDGDYARIHTSCSQVIGPGLVVGNFEVIFGASKNGGPLCSI